MNEFNKNNYSVVRKAISEEVASFVSEYFKMKSRVIRKMMADKLISPFEESWGNFNDDQVPGAYSHYADFAMEVLLNALHPRMEKETEMKLYPNYSYARIYTKGHELKRHKDRFSCEISTTLNLGGDPWPICLDPTEGFNNEGIKVTLNPGDMLLYKGNIIEHWREPLQGEECIQVFLHYNNVNTEGAQLYDGREFLGLPNTYLQQRYAKEFLGLPNCPPEE